MWRMESSGDGTADDVGPHDAGELVLQNAVEAGEPFVVGSHDLEDGRVRVTRMATVHRRGFAKFVDGQDRFEPEDAIPDGEALPWSTEHGAVTSPNFSR